MSLNRKVALAVIVLFAFGVASLPAAAQSPVESGRESGWLLYASVQGTASSSGNVTRFDPLVGYAFNPYFSVDLGVPLYFVRVSDSTTGATRSANGLGDAYADLVFTFRNPLVNYVSTLRGSVPTGSTDDGLSSGRATFDWTNHFDRSFGQITPYLNIGLANTVPDTRFFVRPFTTLGFVSHYQAGMELKLAPFISLDASAYAVIPSGEQKMFSRFVRQASGSPGGGTPSGGRSRVFETTSRAVGGADLTRDNGFSAGLNFSFFSFLNATVGYNRSVHFRLNSIYYGVGVNVGHVVRTARGQ